MNTFNSFFDRFSKFAPTLLQVGLGFVFIWFGWGSITNTEMWVGLVPAWVESIASPEILIKIHGTIELFFGVLLVIGQFVRISALVLFLSLLNTVFLVSGQTQTRDIGLAVAILSVVLQPRR